MDANIPSRAKAYFDEIKLPGNGTKFLKQLAGSETPTFESEFLDFKGGYELMRPEKKDELTKLWAKNLSCFANSDGGVVIFGIDAPNGRSKSISLVQDVAGLQERLKGLVSRITEPPVQRVEIETFLEPTEANTGFVVCYIPSSPWRPHQVRLDGQPGQFYIRTADNCVPCGVSTLRALFAPQNVSRLEIYYRIQIITRPFNFKEVFLHCWLQNIGPATAREAFVFCESPPRLSTPTYDHRFWRETQSTRQGLAIVFERSIHPQEMINICSFGLGTIDAQGVRTFSNDIFAFKFHVAVRDQLPQKFSIEVRKEEVEDASNKRATPLEEKS